MTQQGAGFPDHIPRLEHTLYRRIREPLHFMKLVLGLMVDFGSPIDVSASCRALTATMSFTIGLHDQSGDECLSVETTCNQYLDTRHGATVSRRVKFSRSASSMRKDDDGFLDVEDLRVIVVRETLECMSGSAAQA
ncbi:hypothetical protein CGC20_20315 [Leishmania donovani]|uniref:Uncharacterized protein n=1 Tax=Leishmania donovani TaxID=5661 RepID=A0A504X8P6_LEIDO|nr:hypothetical protein CGC20_21725 [Leishmania donovani]TPP49821.1 hypothetical protein CGC20_20315 [Leishmania donovani]